MRTANEVYKSVKMDWDNITFPLKEGSPISKDGVVSDDAIGLIPATIESRPLRDSVYVLIGGDVFDELDISEKAKVSMGHIRFYKDGYAEPSRIGNLSELKTENKSDLVSALNEVYEQF